ncbi:hypothetical protein SNEBB_006028 [Seison nebaliae]|nr:hypothetical protein SNEBB_006028 [Seison nebaliae]
MISIFKCFLLICSFVLLINGKSTIIKEEVKGQFLADCGEKVLTDLEITITNGNKKRARICEGIAIISRRSFSKNAFMKHSFNIWTLDKCKYDLKYRCTDFKTVESQGLATLVEHLIKLYEPEGFHEIVCPGKNVHIQCEAKHQIEVLAGFYGNPGTQKGMDQCKIESDDDQKHGCYNMEVYERLRDLCDGEDECHLNSELLLEEHDVCSAHSQNVLEFVYKCVEKMEKVKQIVQNGLKYKQVTACEGQFALLDCPAGTLVQIMGGLYAASTATAGPTCPRPIPVPAPPMLFNGPAPIPPHVAFPQMAPIPRPLMAPAARAAPAYGKRRRKRYAAAAQSVPPVSSVQFQPIYGAPPRQVSVARPPPFMQTYSGPFYSPMTPIIFPHVLGGPLPINGIGALLNGPRNMDQYFPGEQIGHSHHIHRGRNFGMSSFGGRQPFAFGRGYGRKKRDVFGPHTLDNGPQNKYNPNNNLLSRGRQHYSRQLPFGPTIPGLITIGSAMRNPLFGPSMPPCSNIHAVKIMYDICQNKPFCIIEVTPRLFGHICPEFTKYLSAVYTCIPRPVPMMPKLEGYPFLPPPPLPPHLPPLMPSLYNQPPMGIPRPLPVAPMFPHPPMRAINTMRRDPAYIQRAPISQSVGYGKKKK